MLICRVPCCLFASRDRQNVLERLHGNSTGNSTAGSGGGGSDHVSKMLSCVTFPEVPPCLRPLGDVLTCRALWKLLATVLDTASSHLLSETMVDVHRPGSLSWVNDSCIQQSLHLIALAISAADQDKGAKSLGGSLWKHIAAHLCASGGCSGDGSGSAIARRRSVIESLVLLQSPTTRGAGGGAGGGRALSYRFQKELHVQLVKSILHKLCDSSAECKEKREEALRALRKTGVGCDGQAGRDVGNDSESGSRGAEDEGEDWKRRQKEAKERMMQVRGEGLMRQ